MGVETKDETDHFGKGILREDGEKKGEREKEGEALGQILVIKKFRPSKKNNGKNKNGA